MKTILCYGDSLTWGYNAEGPSRHAFEDRWPSVLGEELGSGVRVIAEGLNGRTTVFDDHMAPTERNGIKLLPSILDTHSPIDLLVLFLGANDMKPWIAGRAVAARFGVERLVETARTFPYGFGFPVPQILIVSPPPLSATENADFAEMFSAIAESRKLAAAYKATADLTGAAFFDAGSVAETTPLDGVHLDAENTRAVGRGMAPLARQLLGIGS